MHVQCSECTFRCSLPHVLCQIVTKYLVICYNYVLYLYVHSARDKQIPLIPIALKTTSRISFVTSFSVSVCVCVCVCLSLFVCVCVCVCVCSSLFVFVENLFKSCNLVYLSRKLLIIIIMLTH